MGLTFSNPLSGVERCPYCGVANPLLTQLWEHVVTWQDKARGKMHQHWGVYRCSKCNQIMLAQGYVVPEGVRNHSLELSKIDITYPESPNVDESLPVSAKRYLEQALSTTHAPDGAVILAGSAVDAMLKHHGYKDGSLYSRIDKAVSDHVLTAGMGEWAHKVRLDTNDVRHADEERPHATPEEAMQTVEFAKALGDFLFVFPARISREMAGVTPKAEGASSG